MNLQTSPSNPPLRLLVVNSLAPSARLAVTEILLGTTFGPEQLIDVILLVYSNETAEAEAFKMELRACAYSNCNSIRVSSDLPRLSDADVFLFYTNFPNPNRMDYSKIDTEEHFDTMYHILKVAHNLTVSPPDKTVEEDKPRKKKGPVKKTYKPIIVANGLITLHILKTICKDLPPNILFCPTPVPRAAKSVLAEYLKVELPCLSHIHTWAADDQVFHIEMEKPLLRYDKVEVKGLCGKEMVSPETLESLNFDYLQLSEAWIQNELVDKILGSLAKNPYGPIFRASEMVRVVQMIWKSRREEFQGSVFINLGVISDGSLGTVKGLPYVLPLIFEGDNWTVDKLFERDPFLQIEIKRINKKVKEHNEMLVPYCKKFLEDNVIKQLFLPTEAEEASTISVLSESTDFQ